MDLTVPEVIKRVRRDPDTGHGSVYDVLLLVTGQPRGQLNKLWARMTKRTPEWKDLPTYAFDGQHRTAGADIDTLIEIVWDTGGDVARAFRRRCAKLIREAFFSDVCAVTQTAIATLEELVVSPTVTPDEAAMIKCEVLNLRRALIAHAPVRTDPGSDLPRTLSERVSVQMTYARLAREGRIVKARDHNREMATLGNLARKRFLQVPDAGELVRVRERLVHKRPGKPDIDTDLEIRSIAETTRMRHSLAHGVTAVHDSTSRDVWTYPAWFAGILEDLICNWCTRSDGAAEPPRLTLELAWRQAKKSES